MTDEHLQRKNAMECARMGIISFEECLDVFRAIRDKDESIIRELQSRRADRDRDRAPERAGAC